MKIDRAAIISLFTGVLFAMGWAIFIDCKINTLDKFEATHIIPPLGASAAAFAMNMVSISRVSESIEVRIWLFFWFTVSCIAIGGSVWILAREYVPPIPIYPGLGILIQTVLALCAGLLFFMGRKSNQDEMIFD